MSRTSNSLPRSFLVLLTLGLLLLANGCKGPVKGPTAPVEFIREGRRWTPGNPASTNPDPISEVNPDAPAVSDELSAPTRPDAQTR